MGLIPISIIFMLSEEAYKKRLEYTKQWRLRNKEKIKVTQKKRLEDGRMYEAAKKYFEKNPDKVKAWQRKTYLKNRVKRLKEKHKYYEANKEKIAKQIKEYRRSPAGKAMLKRAWAKRQESAHNRLRHNIKNAVGGKLKNHGGKKYWASIDKILPFKIEELEARLESMFKPGMTWENMGKWHVDHIKPDSSFEYTSYEDQGFKDSWALTNLQPLWAEENLSKGAS
jgi:hypothetical protein